MQKTLGWGLQHEHGRIHHHSPVRASTRDVHQRITEIKAQLEEKERRLQEVEEFYDMRKLEVTKKIAREDDKVAMLERRVGLYKNSQKFRNNKRCEFLQFVEKPWFDGVVALVILLNLLMVAMELLSNGDKDRDFFWWDVGILGFYLCEFIARLLLHKEALLCGAFEHVWPYWIDLFIVVAGSGELLLGLLELKTRMGVWASILQAFRVVRVVKLVRLLKDTTWAEESPFQFFIMGVILCNAVLIGAQMNHGDLEILTLLDNFMLSIFCFEILVRIRNSGCRFFCPRRSLIAFYNWLDFTIVLLGAVEQWLLPLSLHFLHATGLTQERLKVNRTTTNLLRLLRLLRLMRLLRLIRDIPPLHTLAVGILESLQGMTWVFLLALLVLYSCGIMCTQLIGHRLLVGEDCPQAVVDIFPHVGESMFVLFKVMNADAQVLDPLFEYMQISKMITAYFMILANWAILAILTAVVSENLINACAQHRKEQEDEKQIRNREKLTQIFEDMDESGSGDRNGKLSKSEFEAKIRTERHKLEESLIEAHIPSDVEHLRELFELRSKQPASDKEPQIELEDFVDCLHFQSKEVSQRTLMRMEGRIKSLQNLVFTLMGEEVDSPKRHGTSPRARARRGADSPGTL